MRNKTKKILLPSLCALLCALTGVAISQPSATVAKAENTTITSEDLKFSFKTLTVASNINVSFYIPASVGNKENIKVRVVEKEADGNVTATLTALATNYEYAGVQYYEYLYKGVAAYEMANELYAYAYADTDGVEGLSDGDVKGDEIKYSVIEYAYKKLGKAGKEKDTTRGLESLLTNMLSYGSAAAVFADDTLPADFSFENDYTYVSLMNAVFEDNHSHGVFKKGETLTVTPNTGYELSETPNGAFAKDGDTITFTVPANCFVETEENSSFVDNSANISAADKVAHEKSFISVDTTAAYVGDKITLNSATDAYEDVTITWTATGASIDGNVVTFTTAGQATLTATIACGDVEETVSFNVDVYTTEERTYVFADYPAGTQYAENEPHVLDEIVTITTNDCHFTSELRLYSSDSNNGYAIIDLSGYYVQAISVNAGNKVDTLNVYGSTDGSDWVLAGSISVASTSYKDYTLQITDKFAYTYLKLDVAGSNQVRLKSMSLTIASNIVETDEEKAQKAADAFTLGFSELTGATTTTLASTAGDATIAWSVSHDNASISENVLTTTNPALDTQVTLNAIFTVNEATVEKDINITLKHELTDKEKVEAIASEFELDLDELTGATTVELPITADEATISWAVEHENATIEENILTTTNPAEDTVLSLTATFTINGETTEKQFTVTLKFVEEGSEEPEEPEQPEEPVVPTEHTASLSFADKAKRTSFTTSKQVWEDNGIVLTNNKSKSTSNVADYANPARFYKSSEVIVECNGMIKIEFTCNSNDYATALKSSIKDATVSVSGKVVTVTFSESVNSFTISAMSAQIRMDSLTVTYLA